MAHCRTGFLAALSALGFTALLSACGSVSQDLAKNPPAAGAKGEAKVGYGDPGPLSLDVDVKNLDPPGTVSPQATIYIVWVRPIRALPNEPAVKGFPIQNIGALKMDGDKGTLEAKLNRWSNFEVFVTAEPAPNGTEPTGSPLLYSQFSLS